MANHCRPTKPSQTVTPQDEAYNLSGINFAIAILDKRWEVVENVVGLVTYLEIIAGGLSIATTFTPVITVRSLLTCHVVWVLGMTLSCSLRATLLRILAPMTFSC